jgi:DDE superfamily endonuclease
MSTDDFGIEEIATTVALAAVQEAVQEKHSLWTDSGSRARQGYITELLNCGHEKRIYQVLRMKLHTFYILRDWCLNNTNLQSSKTQDVSIEDKLVIFLWIVSYGISTRAAQEVFGRALGTINKCFYEVLEALVILHREVVKLPTETTPVAARITDDPKYWPYFTDCLGALDGTHIPVHVPIGDQSRFRNRKGGISQNVLAVCNFDLQFTYVLAGWEGSAHDSLVVRDAQGRHGFVTPKGKYWLGDAGYASSETILTPYRGVRYHLKEQRKASQKPQNSKELFNLRHASLRNVIERIFGVLKNKYQILQGHKHPLQTQILLITALTALHNFVRQKEGQDADKYLDLKELEDKEPGDNTTKEGIKDKTPSTQAMDKFRDELAEKMWKDYQQYLQKGNNN